MRLRTIGVLVITAALVAAMAVPAAGGPSLSKVVKVAKKALKIGKKAQRTARRAARTARSAQSTANTANTTASQALASGVSLGSIVAVEGTTWAIPPGDAESSTAYCPAGYRIVSGGGSAVTGHANGMSASDANEARTAWFVVGGNTSDIDGSVQAWAYCAPIGRAVSSQSRRAARTATEREVAAVEQRVRAALR